MPVKRRHRMAISSSATQHQHQHFHSKGTLKLASERTVYVVGKDSKQDTHAPKAPIYLDLSIELTIHHFDVCPNQTLHRSQALQQIAVYNVQRHSERTQALGK